MAPQTYEMSLLAYILLSLAFLALTVLILHFFRLREMKLILLGLVCAVIATGYASMVPTSGSLAQGMMKIGVILVLGGLALSLFTAGQRSDLEFEGRETSDER